MSKIEVGKAFGGPFDGRVIGGIDPIDVDASHSYGWDRPTGEWLYCKVVILRPFTEFERLAYPWLRDMRDFWNGA
jgi:hypothetical protein